ncbi:WD40-repeat-containing domain protein [Catenaria anguillulae PL171]|uniref:WD40-repeat-containing domain protein n=1 Tax=Catenaria anguillulae PL171 TaxID=765915 RepID=A0A1Y2HY64_9FUNG|nr:WD40-repeat-containing domain protein [Catenaria anguillulae PL171]
MSNKPRHKLKNPAVILGDQPASAPAQVDENAPKQVLAQFKSKSDGTPYAFSVTSATTAATIDISTSIAHDLLSKSEYASGESQLVIEYLPLATFRVRAVTRCGATMPGHTEAVLSAHFAPRGDVVATGSGDHTVRLWDTATGTSKAVLKAHAGWVLCVAWSPDGEWIASGGMDGKVCIWNAASAKGQAVAPSAVLKGHSDAVTSLAWEPMHLADGGYSRLASGGRDATVRVWDVRTRRVDYVLSQHTRAITCVKWGGEGLIYTASRDCSIKVWEAKDGKLVRTLAGHGHWVNTMAVSTELVLRTGAYDHHQDGGSSKSKSWSKEEQVKRAKERYVSVHKGPERMVSGSDDFTMYLWTPATAKQPVARMTGHQALVNHVQFSPSGAKIASASFDKSIKIWDGFTGGFLFALRGHVSAVYQVVFSADERLVMSASKDSTCKVWDMRTKKLKSDLPGHADEVYAADWSPSGERAVSAGKDRMVKVWCQ